MTWALLVLLVLAPVPTAAGDDEKKSKESAKTGKTEKAAPEIIALRGARVMTAAGRTLRRGTVLIQNGKIEAVGDDVPVPEKAEVVDCTGKVITPGFIPATAWSIGIASPGRGFSEEEVDIAGQDSGRGHGALGHVHGPGCVCSYLDWVFKARKSDLSKMERLELLIPDRRLLAQATAIRLMTRACPWTARVSEQDIFDPPGTADTIKGSLDPYGRSLVWCNAAGITAAWMPGTRSLPAIALIMGMASPPTAGTEGVVLKLARRRMEDMYVSKGRFHVMDFRNVVGSKRYTLLKNLEDTQDYRRAMAEYEKARAEYTNARTRYKADKKAKKKVGEEPKPPKKVKKPSAAGTWLPLFEKKRVLRVFAETVSQIRLALHVAEKYGLDLVIDDATEGWAIAAEIAGAGAAVVINPRRVVERTRYPLRSSAPIFRHGWNIENAALLSRAGVKVAVVPPAPTLVTMGIAGRDLLTFTLDAAFAIRGGMDANEALKALTIHPASLLGIDDRTGSLEKGKDADLVVLDGNPFDHKTLVERTYVNGRLVYEKDKEPLFDHLKRGRIIKPVWNWKKAGE